MAIIGEPEFAEFENACSDSVRCDGANLLFGLKVPSEPFLVPHERLSSSGGRTVALVGGLVLMDMLTLRLRV